MKNQFRSPLFIGLIGILLVCIVLLIYQLHEEAVAKAQYQEYLQHFSLNIPLHGSTASSTSAQMATSTPAASASAASPAPTAQPHMRFEVVTTQAAQEQGLGGRQVVPDEYAMLFVFPVDGNNGFWMKDMLVPIDMIWVADNGDIVGIDASVSPDTYPNVFYPPMPVKYVLETKAGFAAEHGWTVGTHVDLPAPYGS